MLIDLWRWFLILLWLGFWGSVVLNPPAFTIIIR
jgi:hypothetical protein